MKNFEDAIRESAKFRNLGPYAAQEAINVFNRFYRAGDIPFRCYLGALDSLDSSASRINASVPDTAPRTWRAATIKRP
ncbi:hypothetical protein CCP4SC76_4600004 [Gammaproteobacteria bacterium]